MQLAPLRDLSSTLANNIQALHNDVKVGIKSCRGANTFLLLCLSLLLF